MDDIYKGISQLKDISIEERIDRYHLATLDRLIESPEAMHTLIGVQSVYSDREEYEAAEGVKRAIITFIDKAGHLSQSGVTIVQ